MAKPDKTPEILGILPLQDAVLFPNTVIPLAVVKVIDPRRMNCPRKYRNNRSIETPTERQAARA